MMQPRVLFVTHGHKHAQSNPGYRILAANHSQFFANAVYVDINPKTHPTYILDVTKNHTDFFEEQFDYIFCMFTPAPVLRSKTFWYNIASWLKPGGIVHTVLPRVIYKHTPDFIFGYRLYTTIGLEPMNKKTFMLRNHRNAPAVVMQKPVAAIAI